MKQEAIADTLIAMLGMALVAASWDNAGNWLYQTGIGFGGVLIGYVMTTYLNEGEEE
jgi:hypothetical protein